MSHQLWFTSAIADVGLVCRSDHQSSSHARIFPKMFLRISERLTKSRMIASMSMRSKRSWWIWRTATEFSLSWVIVLRSHVYRRFKLLNERSTSAKDAGHNRSRRISAITEEKKSRTSFFSAGAGISIWVYDVRLSFACLKHGQLG